MPIDPAYLANCQARLRKLDSLVRPAASNPLKTNAALFGLDLTAVEAESRKNAGANYGMTLVAGRPYTGEFGELLASWTRELAATSGGKLQLDLLHLHSTVGAFLRSQGTPLTEADFARIDFEPIARTFTHPNELRHTFVLGGVYLSEKRDGFIVLYGTVEGPGFDQIQRSMAQSGCPLKPGPGTYQEVYFTVTLGHLDIEVLSSLTEKEAGDIKRWIDQHEVLQPYRHDVTQLSIVRYAQRMLRETVAPDIRIDLTSRAAPFASGEELKQRILQGL